MRTLRALPLFALLALTTPSVSNAALTTMSGIFAGSNENPPNPSPATGVMNATLDDVTGILSYDGIFSGLLAPATAGHFHNSSGPSVNGPVVVSFLGTGTFVTGVTAESFSGSAALSAALQVDFKSGHFYANVHNSVYPGGEIRANMTPEPRSAALLALGLLGVAAVARRRS